MTEPLFHPGTIQTYTGRAYDFAQPDPESICLDDIAHALANACRFAGHTRRFYSVAEHSVRVSWILEAWGYTELWPKAGLLHDGHEAYVWDCPRPFKPLLGDAYSAFADKADKAIMRHFLPLIPPSALKARLIKTADDCALVAEAGLLMFHGPQEWAEWDARYSKVPAPPEGTFPADAVGWNPELAEEAFHHRAKEVGLA